MVEKVHPNLIPSMCGCFALRESFQRWLLLQSIVVCWEEYLKEVVPLHV